MVTRSPLALRAAAAAMLLSTPVAFQPVVAVADASHAMDASAPVAATAFASALALTPKPISNPTDASLAKCERGHVYFDKSCRDPMFFSRFRTKGAEYLGVYGSDRDNVQRDHGVIVVERVDDTLLQYVFVLPDRAGPGEPRKVGTQYRKDYPLAGITSYSTWIDSANMQNTLVAFSRPSVGLGKGGSSKFGIADWSHRAETAGGYRITDSDGKSLLASASSGATATDTCKARGTAQGEFAAGLCKMGAMVAAAGGGVASGVAVGVFLAGASVGAAAPVAAGAGVTIGGTVFTVTAATLVSVCQNLGDGIEAGLQSRCPLVASGTAAAPKVVPASVADADDFEQGTCPDGQVKYSGDASYCTDGGDEISSTIDPNTDIEEIVMDDNYVCTSYHADGQCVLVSAFG